MRALAVMALVGCTGHGSAGEVCSAADHEWSFALPLGGQSIRLPSGSTVVAGDFGRLELGDGLIHNSVGASDLYFASFDAAGVLQNLRRFVADQDLTAITADSDGSLAIAGRFGGDLDLGGGPVTATSERSMYVARFSADGRLIFLRVFGEATPAAIAVSPTTGDIAVTGTHVDPIDLGSGELAGPSQFLLVLDPRGDRVLDRNLADGDNVTVRYAGSEIAIAGSFRGTFDLGGGALANAGGSDIYVGRLDAKGNHLASRSFGGPRDDGAQGFDGDHVALAAVPDGLVLGGGFADAIDLGDGPRLAADTQQDVFVVALDADLEMRWNRVFANPGFQAIGAIDADGDGAVAITGISDSGDLGQALACGGELDPAGQRASHLFGAVLERNGVVSWARCFASTSFAAGTSVSYEGGSVALGGILGGELDVAGAPLVEPADTLGGFTATVTPQCE